MQENKKKESYYSKLKGFNRAMPIILFAAALFIGLCFVLKDTGSLGRAISEVLLGLFSYGAYAIPALVALHAVLYPADVAKRRRISRAIFSLVILLMISSAICVFSHLDGAIVFNGKLFYQNGIKLVEGGFIGNTVAFGIVKAIGVVGYFILAVAVLAIYATCFIARSNVSVAKVFYGSLSKIAGVFASAEKRAKKSREAKEKARAEKNRRRDDERRRDLYRDDYFEVDNGMKELSIDELGINERRSTASVEMNPNLSDSVHHKSATEEPAERVYNDEEIFFSDGTVTVKMSEKPRSADKKIDLDYGMNVSESDYVARESAPRKEEVHAQSSVGIDESADDVFTKDFDPFDFTLGEKLASKPSSKASEAPKSTRDAGIGVFEQSISNLTEEDVAKARRQAEFEERKRKIIEQENAYRRRMEEKERINAEPAKSEPIFSEPVKSEPVFSEPVKSEPVFSEPVKSEPVFSEPVKSEPIFSEPVKSEPVFSEPVKSEPVFSEPVKSEPEFKPYTPPTPVAESAPIYNESNDTIRIERSMLDPTPTEERSFTERQTLSFDSAPAEEIVEEIYTVAEEPTLPKEDDEPIAVSVQPEEDTFEVIEEPIPEEEQNPVILEQRKMFTIFEEPEITAELEPEPESEPADSGMPEITVSDYEEIEDEPTVATVEPEEEDDEPPFEIDPEPVARVFEPVKVAEPEPAPAPVKNKPDYSNYKLPPIDLLGCEDAGGEETNSETADNANKLIETLASFNVTASIKGFDRGPRITRYEVVPAKGVRVSSIMNLFDDIALNLAAEGIRMEAPIPGKSAVGVEIPNAKPYTVMLRSLLETEEFTSAKSKTFVCVGKDVGGHPVFGDISKMPHVLIAGATGMGKSVCINSLLISMLYKARPDEVKFIMIDPKKVEFNIYNGIPHLLIPVVTDPKQAAGALMWAVEQMEKRYDLIEQARVRNIEAYNEKVLKNPGMGEPLPKIVIVVDELADLMLQVKNPVESLIMSIAQKARAAGIHLIIGTQRPSVDIITGVIKANIPTRISCKVMSNADSRTILDVAGAEKLLDKGDMLFNPAAAPQPKRVQGAFVSDPEVESIIEFIKAQASGNVYDDQALEEINRAAQKCSKEKSSGGKGSYDDDGDSSVDGGLYNNPEFLEAVDVAINAGKISSSLLQRKMSIGFGKAAKFIDGMEELGIVSGPNGQKPRDVLISKDEWHEKLSRVSLD